MLPSEKRRDATTLRSVGRPGLDPGTLGVFPEGPYKSITVQICWSDEPDNPSTYVEMLSELNCWLDNWLDRNELLLTANITFAE
jgi:hypothetical protein